MLGADGWNNFENIIRDTKLETEHSYDKDMQFRLCIETDVSCLSNSAKLEFLSLYIIRKHFSWIFFILRFRTLL